MPRRIANGLTLLSAVVCVGSAMLVVRSFVRADTVRAPVGSDARVGARTTDGQLMLWYTRVGVSLGFNTVPAALSRPVLDRIWRHNLTGIQPLGMGGGMNDGSPTLILPLWLLPPLTAIPPVRWWRTRRREAGRGFAVEEAAATAAGPR